MPLLKCPDCGESISDRAQACPRCGRPLRAVTIERTAKSWKFIALTGATIAAIGLWGLDQYLRAAGSSPMTWESAVANTPARVILAGLAVFAVGRIGAWWNNG